MAARPFYFLPHHSMGTISKQLVPNEHTSPAHSAGPWRIFAEDEDYIHIEHIKDGEGAGIIDVYCSEENNRDIEECRANARLVAKAPELLALARKLVVVCDDRLGALARDSDRLQDFFNDDAEADIAERTSHYLAIKDEVVKCIASIERQ